MKLIQTIAFFGLYALTSATPPESSAHRSMAEQEDVPSHGSVRKGRPSKRQAKSIKRETKSGSGDADGTPGDAADRSGYAGGACVPFADISQSVIDYTESRDLELGETNPCLTENACNQGCCRIYFWLICDPMDGKGDEFNNSTEVRLDGLQYVKRSSSK
jgi:hypothetical protein